MLILATKKSKPTPCCSGCAKGQGCAGKKFAISPSGLFLPDRRLIAPRAQLYGTPEFEGVRQSWNRPLLMPTYDMSCLPCCGSGGAPCPDACSWTCAEFFDQEGDCVCLPDNQINLGATTSTCPGNLGYNIFCVDGEWVLRTVTFPDIAALSYSACTEITFQLPEMGANCGAGGGTAKVRVTTGICI